MNDTRCRLRVRYAREGRLAYLGQLELIRSVERCVRRSGLPYSVSRGFSPHMRIAYSSALPVGTSSAAEYFDLILERPVGPNDALRALAGAMPVDIAPDASGLVALSEPSLASWINRASWTVDVEGTSDATSLSDAIARLAGVGSLTYERAGKPRTVDLGLTLSSWEATSRPGGSTRIGLVTKSGDYAGLRPQILVDAAARLMGIEVCQRTRRCGQWHDRGGIPVDPMAACMDPASS